LIPTTTYARWSYRFHLLTRRIGCCQEGIEGDPDVYASLVSKQPTLADHEWMAADTGSVQLTIPPSSDNERR
jgi:hypothetical protein